MNPEQKNSSPLLENESANQTSAPNNEEISENSDVAEVNQEIDLSSSSESVSEIPNEDKSESLDSDELWAKETETETETETEKQELSSLPSNENQSENVEKLDELDNSENIDELAENEIEEKSELGQVTPLKPLDTKQQINLTQKGDFVYVSLPLTIDSDHNQWQRILDDFNTRLRKIDKSWLPDTKVHLQTQDRLLDTRQIQDLNNIFASVQLRLNLIFTKRRQTAVAAASAGYSVQQESLDLPLTSTQNDQYNNQNLAEPLYLKHTIRSGEEICHPHTVIIAGDVNPGASIIADGEIIVWGALKGVAHAGAKGNRESVIMALRMEPTQIRIADLVARAPDNQLSHPVPEVAYISPQGIRIRGANSFAKSHSFVREKQYWMNQRDRLNLGF